MDNDKDKNKEEEGQQPTTPPETTPEADEGKPKEEELPDKPEEGANPQKEGGDEGEPGGDGQGADPKPKVEDPKPQGDGDQGTDPNRPLRYIPLKKHHEDIEKAKNTAREEATAEAQARIKELERMLGSGDGKTPTKEELDERIQLHADKYGMDPQEVRELLELMPRSENGESVPKEALAAFTAFMDEQKLKSEQEHDAREWSEVAIPAIKRLYPNATEDQLKKAYEVLDPIAHSEEGHKYKYSFIVFENQDQIKDIFSGSTEAEPPKDKITAEGARMGNGANNTLTAKDFEVDNPNFSLLDSLNSEEQKTSILKDMSAGTYQKYLSHIEKKQSVSVLRGDRKIELK